MGRQWAAIAISYSGVLVIATKGNLFSLQFDNPYGVILALLSTIIWAIYWILNTRDERDPVVGLFLNFSIPGITGAAYIGVFEMGLVFVLWLMALKLSDSAAKIANLIFIAPFISLVFIYFIVGEPIFPSTVAGLFLVVGGLLIQASGKKKYKS